jgi:HEAT repeat protein
MYQSMQLFVIVVLSVQAPAALFSDFGSADSARRMEILRQIATSNANIEIFQFISLVKEGLRDPAADVRESALGLATARAWASFLAERANVGGHPPPPSPVPAIPVEWKGDEVRIRAELWDVFLSILKNDPNDAVRHQALLAIGNLEMLTRRHDSLASLESLLLDLYRQDQSDLVRSEVVKTFRLEPTTTAEMRAVLRDALVDRNKSVRHEAQEAISRQSLGAATKLPFDEARDTLVPALRHGDPQVRLGAVQALNIYGAPSAPLLATLKRMSTDDPDASVRTSSQLAIEAIQRALRGQ